MLDYYLNMAHIIAMQRMVVLITDELADAVAIACDKHGMSKGALCEQILRKSATIKKIATDNGIVFGKRMKAGRPKKNKKD